MDQWDGRVKCTVGQGDRVGAGVRTRPWTNGWPWDAVHGMWVWSIPQWYSLYHNGCINPYLWIDDCTQYGKVTEVGPWHMFEA